MPLADHGVHGNGHMVMIEKNNLEIAALLADWLSRSVAAPSSATPWYCCAGISGIFAATAEVGGSAGDPLSRLWNQGIWES